ncbi:hypothetical protein EGM92_34635, partial [Enterobacter cloacae]
RHGQHRTASNNQRHRKGDAAQERLLELGFDTLFCFGIDGRLTSQQLQEARACIFAAEVAIKESERFAGIPTVSVPVAEPLRHAEA